MKRIITICALVFSINSFAALNYGFSMATQLTSPTGDFDDTRYYNHLNLRTMYEPAKFILLDLGVNYIRNGSIQLTQDNSYSSSNKYVNLTLLPALKHDVDKWTFFGGVILEWYIYSSQTTTFIDSSNTEQVSDWFTGWAGLGSSLI